MTNFEYYATELRYAYFWAGVYFGWADTHKATAWSKWGANDDHGAIQSILNCLDDFLDGCEHIIGKADYPYDYDMLFMLHQLCWEWGTEDIPEITYKAICEAWGKDDFEGRAVTIAFIDRMRQLIWDEPYSALWAGKPEEQEL